MKLRGIGGDEIDWIGLRLETSGGVLVNTVIILGLP
jgi:hypothetical protein